MPNAPLIALILTAALGSPGDEPKTVAETSDYHATSRYSDVMDFCRRLSAQSKGTVRFTSLGTSTEGRDIPLLIVADPPVTSPEEARKSGKLVALVIGNIHAGEVDGKEGLLMLLRQIVSNPDDPLHKDLVLLAVPIYNADGNEKLAKTNRPGQVGPDEMGVRHNGQGLDLNRDFVKLEAPETRGLVDLINRWDPHVFIDLHTTNGSYHRYVITYQGPKNPAGDPGVLAYANEKLMPGAGKILEDRTGFKSFFYGNFDRDHTLWTTYGATPRFGTTYVSLRDRFGILSESYSYADYKTRVIGSREFARALLEYALSHKEEVVAALDAARAKTHEIGDEVPIRSEPRVAKEKVTVLGYVEEKTGGRTVATKEPKEYEAGFEQEFAPTLTVKRPFAYLIPARWGKAIETVKRHGIPVETLAEDRELPVDVDTIEAIDRAPRPFEGHRTVDLKTATKSEKRTVPAGTAVVKADGPLGNLVVYLLEPRSDDGLATWNFFDEGLKVGGEFPVLRVRDRADLPTK